MGSEKCYQSPGDRSGTVTWGLANLQKRLLIYIQLAVDVQYMKTRCYDVARGGEQETGRGSVSGVVSYINLHVIEQGNQAAPHGLPHLVPGTCTSKKLIRRPCTLLTVWKLCVRLALLTRI